MSKNSFEKKMQLEFKILFQYIAIFQLCSIWNFEWKCNPACTRSRNSVTFRPVHYLLKGFKHLMLIFDQLVFRTQSF